MAFGLTNSGFVRKTLADVKSDLESAMQASFGTNIKLDNKSVFGKIVGVFSQPIADVWELAEAVYNAMYPSTAPTSSALDGSVELIGITRNPGAPSTVTLVIEAADTTVVPAGSIVATDDTGLQFETDAELTVTTASVVTANTSIPGVVTDATDYTITVNGNAYTYTATVPSDDADVAGAALAAAISTGESDVGATHTGGGDVYIEGDPGADGLPQAFTVAVNANVALGSVGNLQSASSVDTGAIQAFAQTITSIANPVSGWMAVFNPLAATLGTDPETDAQLRSRRAISLSAPGGGTVDAILAGLLNITGVTSAFVQENTSGSVDSFGIPGHAFEAVVLGGTDQAIADLIWSKKPAGIEAHGDTTQNVTDSSGATQSVSFTRPTTVDLWLRVTYTLYDEETFPAGGETSISSAVLAEASSLTVGNDVLPDRFIGPVFDATSGLSTVVVEVAEDSGGSPGTYQTAPYSILFNQVASVTAGRIQVVGP
jgi:uncharacterized phage protein gp47/JayE